MAHKNRQKNEYWTSISEWTTRVPGQVMGIVGIVVSLGAFIGGMIVLMAKARHVEPPLPWWDIGITLGGALLFILLSFWAFHRVRVERDQLKGEESREDIKEIEWRKEYRQTQLPEVTQIPPTLQKIWGLVTNILEEKKKRKCTNEKLLSVIVDMLEIDRNDPILNTNNYTSEQK